MKNKLLTPRQAQLEDKQGTPLFFGDGPSEGEQIKGQAELLAVDHCDAIPYLVRWPNGSHEWVCNCWMKA